MSTFRKTIVDGVPSDEKCGDQTWSPLSLCALGLEVELVNPVSAVWEVRPHQLRFAIGLSGTNWRSSLERKSSEAIRFYSAIEIATLIGLVLIFIGIDPIKALFWAAVLN